MKDIADHFDAYLRVCRCGGMPKETSDLIAGTFKDFLRVRAADAEIEAETARRHTLPEIRSQLASLRTCRHNSILAGDEIIFGTLAEFILEVLTDHQSRLDHLMPDRSDDI